MAHLSSVTHIASFSTSQDPAGALRLSLEGRLDSEGTSELWDAIFKVLRTTPRSLVVVNGADVQYCDGSGISLILEIERLYQRTLRFILELHREELGDRDLDLAAFVVAQCMESLTHGAVLHHPELLGGQALEDEITELLVRYLGV